VPKLNNTHLPQRIQEHIEKMEHGEEVEAKKDKTLLNDEQRQALKDALAHQQQLKKLHKRPKTQEEKDKIGWKEIREVRLEIYKQALAELQTNLAKDMKELQRQREAKANREYMDAWSKAIKEGKSGASAQSVGNIALTRAGFSPSHSAGLSKRDREIRDMEDALRKQFEVQASDEEKEHLAILKEHEKALEKRKK
jgi:hypothetical protein